ncbi:hypothetical protein ASPFODRAFT_44110 [Aspergillus luchuensis CBS 106.47]|uniref:Uncharacterized protein n=1 Tax=Aspergillus luchuensis (strain CBS 106.47) TaxID=1137211 RepID=A0A1M3TNK7_ASPLC|nr:hypothetical protein ASPFODRAFT_44110 [Aspergillus luchuensis CBS 106.47]
MIWQTNEDSQLAEMLEQSRKSTSCFCPMGTCRRNALETLHSPHHDVYTRLVLPVTMCLHVMCDSWPC